MTFPAFPSIEVRVTNLLSDITTVQIRCLLIPRGKVVPWTDGWTSLDLAAKASDKVAKSSPVLPGPPADWEVQITAMTHRVYPPNVQENVPQLGRHTPALVSWEIWGG
jgi:hypothetical protein